MSAYPKLFDVLDVNILLSMLGTILTQDAFLLTLKTSHECLKRLEAKG
jgi:plasmid replication initiation protein